MAAKLREEGAKPREEIDKPRDVCQMMSSLMESGLMSDVEFQLDSGDRIAGHRCVFAMASPYFRELLESGKAETEEAGVVRLEDVPAPAFRSATRFIYTGFISLTNSEAAIMLPLAARWGTRGLRNACEVTMSKHISVDNVCESLSSAHKCDAGELRERCLNFIGKNGSAVLASDHFLTLPKECVEMIVEDGNLMVGNELEVYQALVRWGQANKPESVPEKVPEEVAGAGGEGGADGAEEGAAVVVPEPKMRPIDMKEFLSELMPHVRFPTMSPDVIEDEVEPDGFVAPELILEAYRQHARPPSRRKADSGKNPRLIPRRGAARRVIDPSKGRVLPYVDDFDTNGVVYYIGTAGGTKSWANPALDGRMTVSRSSDGEGRAADVTDREKGKHCFTGDSPNSWWCFDLGEKRMVIPSRYTIRHGGKHNTNVLRNWVFEGSSDNKEWSTLKKHSNDETLRGTGYGSASWAVEATEKPFRYFRVRQTGPNNTGDNFLVMSQFELYGTLFEQS